jgi:hypothetical protein
VSRALCLGLVLWPALAGAQAASPPRKHAFEASVGVIGVGPIDFGATTADLVGNSPSGPPSVLFRASSSIGAGVGVDARLAFNITRALAVEGGFVWTGATLESAITSDVEGVPNVTVAQDLDTYFFEASAVWHLNGARFAGGRGTPFLAGGAGYLRQLDEDQMLTSESGRVYHAGGGVKYLLLERRRGFLKGLGLRGDARAYVREGGVELEEGTDRRTTWGLAAAVFVRF